MDRNAGARDLLRHRNFRLLASARMIDFFGNAIAPIALSFAVLDLTDSVSDLGLVVGAHSIANVAVLLMGGVLADRLPRPLVLQGSALVAATSQAVVAASVLGQFASVWLLAMLGTIHGAASAVSIPAASAIVPQTVPADLLRQANAVTRLGVHSAMIIGASFGGTMVAVAGPGWALAIDAGSFLVVALCFSLLRLPDTPRGQTRPSLLRELRDGWAEFTQRSWVWAIVLQCLICNAIIVSVIHVLGPAIADETIGRTAWGLVLAARMLGAVAGGVLAMRWQPRHALAYGTAMVMFSALPILALAHVPWPMLLAISMFVSGAALEQFGVAWEVSLQQNIPSERLARVYSYDALGSFLGLPLGQLSAGPLAIALGTTQTLDGAALLLILATTAVLIVPSVRRLTTHTTPSTPSRSTN